MAQITKDRCRQVLIDGIDKILNHRFLSWLSNEQNAVLMGCRSAVVADDAVVDKIVSNVGPYQSHGDAAAAESAELARTAVVAGTVASAQFSPGFAGDLLILGLDGGAYVWVCAGDPDSEVTASGRKLTGAELISWLAAVPCAVRAWPLADLMGAATRAEFSPLVEPSNVQTP